MIKHSRKFKEHSGTPDKYPQGYFKPKACKWCKGQFEPMSPCHKYCSPDCKEKAYADSYYKRTYGISLEEYNNLKEAQGERCAVCGGEGFRMHKGIKDCLVVDHCHQGGHVRGLLCNNCNRALGLFQDSIDNLKKAIGYLGGV